MWLIATARGLVIVASCLTATTLWAQTPAPRRPSGRMSIYFDSASRVISDDTERRSHTLDVWTAVTFESPEPAATSGVDFRLDMRHSRTVVGSRAPRVSIYDAYVGGHVGSQHQLRVRAGHLWLQEVGSTGSLAGGVVEFGQPPTASGSRFRVGGFAGREPTAYELGYVADVRKMGGYAAFERGFLQRHVVGYTRVSQQSMVERSVVSVTNTIPAGQNFFAYQAAEYDVTGPAQGIAKRGLSYFLTNVRANATEWLELTGTYNRGRSVDARTLTDDLLHGRVLTPQAVEGLTYESRGGRASVIIGRHVRVYGSYAQDRTNRDDTLTGRVTVGGQVSNLGGSGVDVTASDSRINRQTGAYHATFVSMGRSIGRDFYVSGDYTTSLSVVQFVRGDGLIIETRPWSKRFNVAASANMSRSWSFNVSADITRDSSQVERRILSGLSYRIP